MKNDKIKSFISLSDLPNYFKDSFKRERMIQLENKLLFSVFWKEYAWRTLSLALLRSRKRTARRLQGAWNFMEYLYRCYKRHGITWVVKYLKASHIALSRAVAGSPLASLQEVEPDYIFPRLTKGGLPKVIGTRDRRSIGGGSTTVIRYWMTLFSIYRVLSAPGKLKFNTITDTFSGSEQALKGLKLWCGSNTSARLKRFMPYFDSRKGYSLDLKTFDLTSTSSPSSRVSWKGLVIDRWALSKLPEMENAMREFATLSRNTLFLKYFDPISASFSNSGVWRTIYMKRRWTLGIGTKEESLAPLSLPFVGEASDPRFAFLSGVKPVIVDAINNDGAHMPCVPIGQLAFKNEPAGKIRVFAMVDWWTQQLLRPLHELLFAILRKIPNDGTFDQDASFKRCVEKAKTFGVSYGYDLSAATDRLPIALQSSIVSALARVCGINGDLGPLWSHILVNRDYFHYDSLDHGVKIYNSVRYGTGQPMGALSSWAMLAITHHMIVQYSAYLAGIRDDWFEGYEILGDDIQIFNSEVAAKYLMVMGELGVEINLSKSVVSPSGSVVEYAKRVSFNGLDVSAISWRMILSSESFSGRVAVAMHMLRKDLKVGVRKIIQLATSPTGVVTKGHLASSTLALVTSFAGRRGVSLRQILTSLVDAKGKLLPEVPRIRPDVVEGINVPVNRICKTISAYYHTREPAWLVFSAYMVRERSMKSVEERLKTVLNERLGDIAVKLCQPMFIRACLNATASKLWSPVGNEKLEFHKENDIANKRIQEIAEALCLGPAKLTMSKYVADLHLMKKLGLTGLLTPRRLSMSSLDDLMKMKQDLAGVLTHLQSWSVEEAPKKERIVNSLKIIKILLLSLEKGSPPKPRGFFKPDVWDEAQSTGGLGFSVNSQLGTSGKWNENLSAVVGLDPDRKKPTHPTRKGLYEWV